MDIKIHLHADDKFSAEVVGGNNSTDWLDLLVPGGRIELFIPLNCSAEFAECLLRAAIALLERVRERGKVNEESECPATAPDF